MTTCCSKQDQAAALAMSQYLECTDPAVADLDYKLPLGADIIVTGVVVAAGPGRALCKARAANTTGALASAGLLSWHGWIMTCLAGCCQSMAVPVPC